MGEEQKSKRIGKRLPAPITIGLRKLQREKDRLQNEFTDWMKERCEELGYYYGQINFVNLAIMDPIIEGKIIGRLPLEGRTKEILTDARIKFKEVREAENAFNYRLEDISLQYSLTPKSLNLDNGEISENVVLEVAKTVEELEQEKKAENQADKI